MNGAFDPCLALGSVQPLGFDQYCALYRRNCVVGWKVRIEWCTSDNTNPVCIGFTPKTDNNALTSYPHWKECKGTVSTILTPDIDKAQTSTRGDVKKWMTHPGAKILDNEDLVGSTEANPVSVLYGHVWAQAMDGAANPSSIRYVVTLEQIVVFFEQIVPARS